MKNRRFCRLLSLLLIAVMALGLCACGYKPVPLPPTNTEASLSGAAASVPVQEQESIPATVVAAEPTPEPTPEPIVGEVLTDEDGDGIINYKFHYKGATVYAMIILDPSRVFIGTAVPTPGAWGNGLTLDVMAQQYDAVAGINAGGFLDEGGAGNGWPPNGITYSRGVNFATEMNGPIAGLDGNDHLWAGYYEYVHCEEFGIRDAVCFGPALIENGVKTDPAKLESGIGARTAIGQREDGSIVMVVIDGRQGYSIGVTFEDCIRIMADKFGCVNAANMDGGNSSCMYFAGAAVNRSSNQAGGTRNLPDAWLVSALPASYVKPESVPDKVVLPMNPLGEIKVYANPCDPETSGRLFDFANAFAGAYYGYFGTRNADYYYSTVLQYVAQDSELRQRIDMALMDRRWVNTWSTEVNNIVLDGAYSNGDGSYDIIITSDIHEHADYWNYEAPGTTLRITAVEAPGTPYGYLATATF